MTDEESNRRDRNGNPIMYQPPGQPAAPPPVAASQPQNFDQRPLTSGYTPLPATNMWGLSQNLYGGINANESGLNQYRQEALRQGPSTWRGLMQKQVQNRESEGMDEAARKAAGQQAQARSSLAMHGGLGGGAAERIAKQGGTDYFNMAQGVANQAGQQSMGYDVTDEENRIRQLGALPGMELSYLEPKFKKSEGMMRGAQYDADNTRRNTELLNAFLQNKNLQELTAWENEQKARALESEG